MPRFPFFCHRTLAEVERTKRLLAMSYANNMLNIERHELSLLLARARENNPPPEPGAA